MLVIVLLVFAVSAAAPFALRPLLLRAGIIDRPNSRSSHTQPTLRAGGLAPLFGWLIGITLTAFVVPDHQALLLVVGTGSTLLALVGLADDLRSLKALPRLALQIAIAAVSSVAILLVLGGGLWLSGLVGVLLVVGYVNAANFMDGVNGLSALHGTVVGGAFAVAGTVTENTWLTYLGAIIAAAFVAFLPWNLRSPGMFLGDVGSYLLGAAIALTAIAALGTGVPVELMLTPLAVYVADTGVTLVRRLARGEDVLAAHRAHTYQRLTDSGMSHVSSTITVSTAAAVCAVIGVTGWVSDLPLVVTALLAAAVCALYLSLPTILRRWTTREGGIGER